MLAVTDISYIEFCRKFKISDFQKGSSKKTFHVVWCFPLPITATELWPYISDTSRFNRELGLAQRQEREVEGQKIVTTKLLGFKQEWVEEPWTWFFERSIESLRIYKKGIAKSARAVFILDPKGTTVDLYINFSWSTDNLLGLFFLKLTNSLLKKNFLTALIKISTFVKTHTQASPKALQQRNDPAANVNLPALEKAAQVLRLRKVNSKVVDGICEFIKYGDDIDLYRIKAITLANNLQMPKGEILKACMESVRYGLLSITWDVICPHCRGVRVAAESFGKIPQSADCLVCDVDFQTDTLESIEVVFHVHPTYRKVTEVLFCAAEPAKKDHLRVQEKLMPFQNINFQQILKEGRHRLRLTNPTANFYFEVQSDSPNKMLFWDTQTEAENKVFSPEISVTIENKSSQVRSLNLEQLWWKDDILHPGDIFSMPEYQDVFSRESLNSNVKISLGVQVIMFTDIVNSTQFYTEKGDASAFKDVKNHFVEAFEVVQKQDGSVIKTIGDSIMACFLDPDKAMLAAMELQKRFWRDRSDTSIRLRISLHVGQVIAVHLLQGLDLFGTTVNMAAKLQGCANAGEISFSEDFYKACDSKNMDEISTFCSKRKSKVLFKDIALEAYVLNHHEMVATKALAKAVTL